jgi:LPXTG-site transpeptidase (sortase) family protein
MAGRATSSTSPFAAKKGDTVMRRWQTLVLVVFLFTPGAQATLPARADTGDGQPILFTETGHTLAYNFGAFYAKLNGAIVFGLPLTEVFIEDGRPVQYFERARLDWHADLGQVQIADLGRYIAAGREHEAAFRPIVDAPTGAIFFDSTGHTISGAFQRFFLQFGGRAVFGAPISEEFRETDPQDGRPYLVQYFERARFRLHPGVPWPKTVSLADLGREYLVAHPAPVLAQQPVDSAARALEWIRPTRVSLPRIGVDVAVEERGSAMGAWDVPRDDVGHFWPIAAFPGTAGNIILGGHSDFRDEIFNHLPQVRLGDEVLVAVGGQQRRYIVKELLVVLPDDTSVLKPSSQEQLTLITCVPYRVNSHRLIVRAFPAQA